VVVNNLAINCPPPTAPATSNAGATCGFLPATVTVSVAAGTVIGQDITLQNKFAPAAGLTPATGANAFGYVVNGQGQGVGGIVITASTGSATGPVVGTAVCPSPPSGVGATTPVPGTCTQTGLWIMNGLPAGTTVFFTISGPGLTAANVRPALTISRTTTGVGTWIDPNWVIIQSGPLTGSIPLPILGSALIRGTVTDSQGQPFTGAGAFVVLYRNSTRTFAASTVFAGTTPAVRGPGLSGGAPVGFFPAFGLAGNQTPIAAAALDAGGNYCFGSGTAPTAAPGVAGCPNALVGVAGTPVAQPPLLPDSYLVTVIDDRPTIACVAGFQPPAGASARPRAATCRGPRSRSSLRRTG
jgi:hypothetical protein